MIVDCSTCTVRGAACSGCVVTLLFGAEPGREVPWHNSGLTELLGPTVATPGRSQDDVDRAIAVLAAAGMLDASEVPLTLTLSSPSPGLRSLGA